MWQDKKETKYIITFVDVFMRKTKVIIALVLVSFVTRAQGNGQTFEGVKKCQNKTFSVSIHILEDTLGRLNVSDAQIAQGIAGANDQFSDMCASFDVCSTYVHPNVRNNKVRIGIEDKEISAMYEVPNTINIYYVLDIIGASSPCGFAPLGGMSTPGKTPSRDAIFIKKSCATDTKTMAHELGHYFGLFHTFERNTNGVELVNGSNCSSAGDLICDTPADPSGTAVADSNCDLDPAIADNNGDYYTPSICNIMSYYNNACNGIKFTTGQYNRMIEVMEKGRNYLW